MTDLDIMVEPGIFTGMHCSAGAALSSKHAVSALLIAIWPAAGLTSGCDILVQTCPKTNYGCTEMFLSQWQQSKTLYLWMNRELQPRQYMGLIWYLILSTNVPAATWSAP